MKEARGLNGLPWEMVWLVLERTDLVTAIACRHVASAWHDMIGSIGKKRFTADKAQCRVRNRDGMYSRCLTPRRCACKYAKEALARRHWGVFEWMIERAGPFGCVNDADQAACTVAAMEGDVKKLKALAWVRRYRVNECDASDGAARYGQLNVLRWLERRGYRLSTGALGWAIRGGHEEVAEWLMGQAGEYTYLPSVPYEAARYGRMRMLEKAEAEKKIRAHDGRWVEEATMGGRVDVLEWLAERGNVEMDGVVRQGIYSGQLEVAKWAVARGGVVKIGLGSAARKGDLEMVKWLWEEMGMQGEGQHACECAARAGHAAVVEWLLEQGCESTTQVCDQAICGGNMDVIELCMTKGHAGVWIVEWFVNDAACGGHVEVLEWLYHLHMEREGPTAIRVWKEAMVLVADRDHVRVLEWLEAHGIEAEDDSWARKGSECAANRGHMCVLVWMAMRGLDWDRVRCCEAAASRGDIDMLEWLAGQGCSWTETVSVKAALMRDRATVEWLRAHGAPWNGKVHGRVAALDTRAAQWALKNGCGGAGTASGPT